MHSAQQTGNRVIEQTRNNTMPATKTQTNVQPAIPLAQKIISGWRLWLAPALLCLLLLPVSYYNFLMFHTMVELFAVVTAIILSVVAFYTYRFSRNAYLMYLGTGYFWIAILDLMHTLTYKGMHILPWSDANTSIQYWVVTRLMEALLLLTAPLFLFNRLKREYSFAIFAIGSSIIIFAIYRDWVPDAYIDGKGLTHFKIYMEYVVIALLMGAVFTTYKLGVLIDNKILPLVLLSIVSTILAELCFTLYVSVYGTFIFIGHLFKLVSYWLIFFAVVRTTLTEPYEALSKTSSTYDAVPMPTIVVNKEGIIQQINHAASDTTGLPAATLVNSHCHKYFHAEDTPVDACMICSMITKGQELESYELCINKDKWAEISLSSFDTDFQPDLLVHVSNDVSDRKNIEKELFNQANYDQLTKLPNRNLITDRLLQTILRTERSGKHAALMFIDLDNFKNINDTLGHNTGDQLLVKVSRILYSSVRESDIVGRWGGDEFLVILSNLNSLAEAEPVAAKILTALTSVITIDNNEFHISASIGISGFPDDGQTADQIMSHADSAMYMAKEAGKNNYRFFSPEINEEAQQTILLDKDLRRAIDNNELSMVYQPQIDMKSGAVIGAEALLRWKHPELGFIPPDKFIPVAEKSSLIEDIGEWAFSQACNDAIMWKEVVGKDLFISVNFSSRQIRHAGFIGQVGATLGSCNINPEMINIEITESLLLQDTNETIVILETLKQLGMKLSLDDFGTGYSSLSYLQKYPFDEIKIDRRFIRNIHIDKNDASLCRAIIAMANSLELRIVGEGVETVEQLDFLKQYSVNAVQGYFFSRPVPHEEFLSYLGYSSNTAK